jgi:exodeoxyribonuclease V alpha subunit
VEAFDAIVTIRRQRFANPENGFAVVDARAEDGEFYVLVGSLAHLEARERVRIRGTVQVDPRFGEQIKVSEALSLPPSDEGALIAYLRRVKHIGEKRARALVDAHGAGGVLQAIDREPASAFRKVGLSAFRAQEAAASWHALRVTRQLHLLLAPHGLAYLVARIHTQYGDSAHRVLAQNPYELTRMFGVAFATTDRIAHFTLPPGNEHPGRRRAAVIHLLSEAERGGSTCLPMAELASAARALLGQPLPEDLLDELVISGDILREGEWVYRRPTAEVEEELAGRVLEMVASTGALRPPDPDAVLVAGGGTLTAEQRAGVLAAFTHRLSVITGGPGTGKTSTIRAIATLAAEQRAKVLLCAPTGRAAARMRESSGVEASTVHSALGWIPGEGPTHDEDDPVGCDLLILDESSMANQELMITLMRAVGRSAHVVLVGDADQLAPVGAGKPFAELVASEVVPTARLTHIFRQAAGSMIVQGAHAIRRGEVPEFTPGEGMRRDLFLIERNDPRDALQEVVTLVAERLPAHYGVDPVSDIQVFAPVYRGEVGIDALNDALRARLNPDGAPVRGGRLRIGDKLMMTGRNLHELRLMNGTLLRLLDEVERRPGARDDDAALLLAGDDGSIFRLPPEETESLRLAYACSVHRGQGIELPVAVIVAHTAAGAFFLRREMLYTALTRARLATVIVGQRAVVAQAVRTPDTGRRHSRLGERLRGDA